MHLTIDADAVGVLVFGLIFLALVFVVAYVAARLAVAPQLDGVETAFEPDLERVTDGWRVRLTNVGLRSAYRVRIEPEARPTRSTPPVATFDRVRPGATVELVVTDAVVATGRSPGRWIRVAWQVADSPFAKTRWVAMELRAPESPATEPSAPEPNGSPPMSDPPDA